MLASGLAAAAAHPGPPTPGPAIVLGHALPNVVRINQRLTVAGRVRGAPRGAQVALQSQRLAHWQLVTSASLDRRGSFILRWRVGERTLTGPLRLRVALLRRGRLLAATAPAQSAVGSAAVYCQPPVPPAVNIPVGDGWIVGGVYSQGGPFPGIYQCAESPYTISVTDASGTVVASQNFPALHSYTLVVPAGSYALTSGECRGMATVTAGRQTQADTDCDFP